MEKRVFLHATVANLEANGKTYVKTVFTFLTFEKKPKSKIKSMKEEAKKKSEVKSTAKKKDDNKKSEKK